MKQIRLPGRILEKKRSGEGGKITHPLHVPSTNNPQLYVSFYSFTRFPGCRLDRPTSRVRRGVPRRHQDLEFLTATTAARSLQGICRLPIPALLPSSCLSCSRVAGLLLSVWNRDACAAAAGLLLYFWLTFAEIYLLNRICAIT
jgi:hypothetical protein